jgi:tetratricopeptide (TPR) repeat protein
MLAKLKERADRDPTPANIGELARHYIQYGDNDAAYDLLEANLKRYPDSEILKGIWNYVSKSKVSGKIRTALDALQEEPTPERYMNIIGIYRSQRDFNSALDYCRQFVKAFPESIDAHRTRGELRFIYFSDDFAAKDARAAEEALRKALEIDPEDVQANLYMARLYYCCGLVGRAQPYIEKALAFDGEHEEGLQLKALIDAAEDKDDDPYLRYSEIEERSSFYYGMTSGEPAAETGMCEEIKANIERCLAEALELEELKTAVFVDREGTVLEPERADGEGSGAAFTQFVNRLGDVAHKASLRMDIGAFKKGIVEGKNGGIVMRDLRGGTVAFQLNDRQSIRKVYPRLRGLVDEMTMVYEKSGSEEGGTADEEPADGTE